MQQLLIENLSVRYDQVWALEDVNLVFRAGAVTGIIGPNGGGKSTLIKSIAGEVTEISGRVLADGKPLDRTRTRIAYVPQARDVNWDFPLSARDLVMMGRSRDIGWFGWPSRDDKVAVDQALERLAMAELGDRHISQFSGGQQQRLFLARAIVQRPEIVLLDEPMTGLDVLTREIIHGLVGDFVESGAAVILATHDLEEIEHICEDLICLNRRVIAAGPLGETFNATNLRATFGGRIAVFEAT